MKAYYNEIDRYCCDWLQNLMDAGHITPGRIDDRPIADLSPNDVRGYERCHFFAGIAGWDLALELAGWPANRPVWTGSCPCQPFSAAGRGKAGDDERHLWPDWARLIRSVRPPVIFGEQVEAAIGWGWLDLVCSDLGAEGYTVGAAVLPACGVGAPHIRQRLWFVADAMCTAVSGRAGTVPRAQAPQRSAGFVNGHIADRPTDGGETRVVSDAGHEQTRRSAGCDETPSGRSFGDAARRGAWDDLAWLACTDGKARPVEPTIQPLAHTGEWGSGSRVGMLRAAGNAIVPALAAEFIKAVMP